MHIHVENIALYCILYNVVVIFFSLKGAETPAMPTSNTSLPSGNTVRVRRVASMKNLTESQASSIGLANYYHRYVFSLVLSLTVNIIQGKVQWMGI